eukprot:TRINITY_DN687_c2_g1_i2.p1 TRINITY_DN687_c2_g1~~TRINITY_DN687_c2_g1_i2.p1  ORF type:complete len:151 (+),score=12.19 TRINITY_DN687_c2_g1_i2:141-593(+)
MAPPPPPPLPPPPTQAPRIPAPSREHGVPTQYLPNSEYRPAYFLATLSNACEQCTQLAPTPAPAPNPISARFAPGDRVSTTALSPPTSSPVPKFIKVRSKHSSHCSLMSISLGTFFGGAAVDCASDMLRAYGGRLQGKMQSEFREPKELQ